MEQKSIIGVAALIVVVIAIAAIALTFGGESGNDDGGDDGEIPSDIQAHIDDLVADRQYVADNMVPQIVDAFAEADDELIDDNARLWTAHAAFGFADSGMEYDTMAVFFDSNCQKLYEQFQNIPLFFQSVTADDRWRGFDRTVVLSSANGDSEEIPLDGYFAYLPGIRPTDFSTMLWSGGLLYASSDATLQSEDGEILQVRAGYHDYGSFGSLELWRFPPGTCFVGNILPTPEDEDYGTTEIRPAIVIGDGLSGVMAYGNGFMSMDSGEVYDSFVIDLLWKYEEYNGAVEQDFVDAIGAYGDFLDRICTEVQATYDLAEECYNMNPEERPWELTIGYNPSGSS